MTRSRLLPAVAVVATGAIASGLALTTMPAFAGTSHPGGPAVHSSPAHVIAPRPARVGPAQHVTRAQLAQVRAREARLAAQHRSAPSFDKAGSKTFTVNTTADTDLANPAGTTCVTAAHKCSLRAAVEAANNVHAPVKIVLGKHTYTLTLATALTVTNPKGVSVVGQGAGKTAIAGDGSGLFYVTATASGKPSGHLFLTSLKLENGSTSYGGAIYLYDYSGADVVLDHVTASDNTASSYGGVIYAEDYNGVYISHSTLTHNHAPYGGAIYADYGDVQITDSKLDNNSTPAGTSGDGGALYLDDANVSITGGSISHNQAGDASHEGTGGAIYDDESQTTLTNVHIDHNTATDGGGGGAIYAYLDALEVNHGTMSGNHAGGSGDGGAVYIYYGGQQSFHGVTMSGNHASATSSGNGGGAIYEYSDFYGSQLVIDSGTKITGSNNSAVYLYLDYGGIDASIDHSTLAHNTDAAVNGMYDSSTPTGCGGAVCAFGYEYGGLNLEMTSDHVTSNSSSGVYAAGAVEAEAYEYATVSVQMHHDTFAKNHSGGYGYGGAVGIWGQGAGNDYAPVTAKLYSNKFIGNRAGTQAHAGYGGGLFLYDYVNAQDHGSTFTKNKAMGDEAEGGGVADYSYQSTSFTHSTFTGNTAGTNKAGNDGYGGAYFSEDYYGGNRFDQVTMSGNKASSEGGAFYGDDTYEATFLNSTISGNTAGDSHQAGYGGGILQDGVLTVENSTLTGNRALTHGSTHGQGGAIWADGSRADIRYSTVSGNDAARGAGIYADGEGGSVLSSILSGNKTKPHGSERDCDVESSAVKLDSLGGNVLGQASCVTGVLKSDKVSKNAHLGKLKNNGGPTKTMAISAKSPAVGRATFQVPGSDQRGHKRPGNHADAGAFERS